MYAELQMELETKEINYRQSSNLQGVIMENISPEYAARQKQPDNQINYLNYPAIFPASFLTFTSAFV